MSNKTVIFKVTSEQQSSPCKQKPVVQCVDRCLNSESFETNGCDSIDKHFLGDVFQMLLNDPVNLRYTNFDEIFQDLTWYVIVRFVTRMMFFFANNGLLFRTFFLNSRAQTV